MIEVYLQAWEPCGNTMCKTDLSVLKNMRDRISSLSSQQQRFKWNRVGAREYEAAVIRESGPSYWISEPPVLSVSRLTRLNTA